MDEKKRGIRYALPSLAAADADAIYRRFSAKLSIERISPDTLVCEATETVFNRSASMRDIRKRLRALPLRETIQILGTIAVEIDRGRQPMDAVLQVRVACELVDDSRRARALLRRLISNPGAVLVDEEQIAVLNALALRYCEGAAWLNTSGMALLETLLAFHSVRGAEVHADDVDDYKAFRRVEMRATSTDPEKITDVLSRWMSFIDWSKSLEGLASANYIDLEALCSDALEMSYLEWATATWGFTTPFAMIQSASDGSRRYDAFIDEKQTISSFEEQAPLERFFAATSIEAAAAKTALENIATTSLSELEIFMKKPLVITEFGTCCPVLRFLPSLAGSALIFRLGAHLDSQGQDAGRLRSFWGEFLESYVFDQIAAASVSLKPALFREKKYGTPEKKSSDISLFQDRTAVFIDVTATRFRLRDSVVGLNNAKTEEDLERFIVHKVCDEIARCAREFRAGELQFEGINPHEIDTIFALAVSPQNVPRMIVISEALERMIPTVPDGLAEWEFFDLNEIELLPLVFDGKLDLGGLIASKRANAFGRPRSLTNFLYYTDRELFRVNGDPSEVRSRPWFSRIINQAKGWGLKSGFATLVLSQTWMQAP